MARSDIVPFIRSPYNYDREAVSSATGLFCPPEEGKAQQQFRDETDINFIVKQFGLTGQLPEGVSMPLSGDFTEVMDFQSAMNMIVKSNEAFMQLPGELRYRFANDPQRLMHFLEDPGNRDEAIKLGLVSKPPEVDRSGVVVAPVVEVKPSA